MLTQEKADALMTMRKNLVDQSTVAFPLQNSADQFEAVSEDGHETFVFDVNRKGKVKLSKCTYLERYAVVEILVRLDVDGPERDMPTNGLIRCRLGFSPTPAIW